MNWNEFAVRIGLDAEAIRQMEGLCITEEEYERLRDIYRESHEQFFLVVKKQPESPLRFLELYCRLACGTFEEYKRKGIEESIFWATFRDISLWCGNYKREYGTWGIEVYCWLWRHVDMTILRLGRLQFEEMISEGESVINVHIPQGEKLDRDACIASFENAFNRYGKEIQYICHSWLLYPGLSKVLDEASNIIKFQQLFQVIRVDYEDREAEWRIFGRVDKMIKSYPEDTALQRKAKEYLLQGRALGNGLGILPAGEF